MSIRSGVAIAAADRAESKNLEMMTLNSEISVASQHWHETLDRAGGETHNHAAPRADKVVTMARERDDVRRVSSRLKQTPELIEGGENLKRAIDR